METATRLEWSDARKVSAETGDTIAQVMEKHEIVNLDDAEKSKLQREAEKEIVKEEARMAAAHAKHLRGIEQTQSYHHKKAIGLKLAKRAETIQLQIVALAQAEDHLREALAVNVGDMQTLHEPLNFVTGLIRIERAKALWPEMLAAVQAEQAQNESEVASLGKELGIKLD